MPEKKTSRVRKSRMRIYHLLKLKRAKSAKKLAAAADDDGATDESSKSIAVVSDPNVCVICATFRCV